MFSRIAKPEMFGLAMAPKENFLAYSTQFIFLITRLVPGNLIWSPLTFAERAPSRGSGYMELREACITFYKVL